MRLLLSRAGGSASILTRYRPGSRFPRGLPGCRWRLCRRSWLTFCSALCLLLGLGRLGISLLGRARLPFFGLLPIAGGDQVGLELLLLRCIKRLGARRRRVVDMRKGRGLRGPRRCIRWKPADGRWYRIDGAGAPRHRQGHRQQNPCAAAAVRHGKCTHAAIGHLQHCSDGNLRG
jgi:hypothetical protein